MSLSAGDWTRLQRRKAGTQYAPTVMRIGGTDPTNKDIAPAMPVQTPYAQGVMGTRSAGSLKTARPASDWTNYVDSQVADYVLKSSGTGGANENAENQGYRTLRLTRICKWCSGTAATVLNPKLNACTKCALGKL
jgi:hypothetical protein